MIILGKPYISDFLLETLERTGIQVIHNNVAEEFGSARNLNLVEEDEAVKLFCDNSNTLLYTNSENSISWIEQYLHHTDLPAKLKLFKNKILFRNLVQDMYPGYFYKGIALDLLYKTDVRDFPFPCIIKPAVGFFSLGVYKVDHPEEWMDTVKVIKEEIELIRNLYPPEVLHLGEFIVEECIIGDEFAVDCYFNREGKPVVLNIMKHIFSSVKDVNDRVYIASKEIIDKYNDPITEFLTEIGKRASLFNFPAHVEVRISENGKVSPIEVNPLRFGGWCSTPDLAWYAYGINLYEYLFQQKQPDWNSLLEGKEGLVYSNIVLNNSTGTEGKNIKSFDYEKLLADFNKPLELRKADFRKFPIFGFLFCETRKENMQELDRILMSDLNEYTEK